MCLLFYYQTKAKISKLNEENQAVNASICQYTSLANTIPSNSASSTLAPMGEGLGALPENLEATFTHSDVDQTSARATVCLEFFFYSFYFDLFVCYNPG